MIKYLDTVRKTKLFFGLNDEEIISALDCLNATEKNFVRGESIFRQGDGIHHVCLIISGEAEVYKSDFYGNKNIISRLFASDIIGAAASYSSSKKLPFDIVCAFESKIIFMDAFKLMRQCSKNCAFHSKIISNMLSITADKNITLTEKIDLLSKRTIREKLLAYLYNQSRRLGSKRFSINLSRRQLADYLSVNRSAMIRELSNMKKDNLIDFADNIFWFTK